MADRVRIELTSRPATIEERAEAVGWVRLFGIDEASGRFGCLAVALALPVLVFGLTPWSSGWFVPLVGVAIIACVFGGLYVIRRRSIASLHAEDLHARVVSLNAGVAAAWRLSADESREADVLLELAPGVQVFGVQSCTRFFKPEIVGDFPASQIRFDWLVIDRCPRVKAEGQARLCRVASDGPPVEVGAPLKWSEVSTRAYDISVYEEGVDPAELGRYPSPTAIELLHDISKEPLRAHAEVIDRRGASA